MMLSPTKMFLITLIISFLLSGIIVLATFWGYITKPDIEKISVYECGFMPYHSARRPMEIQYYIVALLFIIFDIEILILFPFVFKLKVITTEMLCLFFGFLFFVFLSIFYEMQVRALDY